MKTSAPTRRPQPFEEGYMLVAVIFLVALLTISLAIALPRISKEIQRDREVETMHRGKQYIRAIRMYYKKFGQKYPPNIDALVKPTNNIRFLRKKYTDLTTGKEDWKPVLYGQNKAPTAMGFFGVPLSGSTIAGVGPGAQSTGFNQSTTTATSDPNAQADPNNPNAASSTTGQTGQTFGGVGIIGFSPNSPKKSIMVYKTKNHYNEWEFVYDPIVEKTMMSGGSTGLGGSNSQGGNNNTGDNTGASGNSGGTATTPSTSP